MKGKIYFVVFFLNTVSVFSFQELVNCTTYRENFSNYVSAFSSCAIAHSQPVKMCQTCVDLYINVTEGYSNMSKFSDKEGPCISRYVNLDRLQIFNSLYNTAVDLWSRAKCNECFNIINGKLTHNFSQNTYKFINLFNDTRDCINFANRTGINGTAMCDQCMESYVKLNDFYYSIINENEKIAGCIDIVDSMNRTRAYWSKYCVLRRKNEYIFLGSTVFMGTLTILFYILVKIFSDKKIPLIFKQSRFAESLNHINEE